MPPKTPKATVLHGIRWNLATSLIRRVISLILLFFLAKWLSQEDFGIFRTYSLILMVGTILAVFGMDNQFLTNKRHPKLSLFSFTQLGLFSGLVFSIILAILGKSLGRLYGSAELGLILQLSSGFVLVEIFRRRMRVRAQALLKFRELALAETWNVIFYSVLGVVIIFFFRKVWVYILLFFLGNLIEAGYLLVVLPPDRGLSLKRLLSGLWLKSSLGLLNRNLSFNLNVSLTSLINNYAGNAPILFLGTMVEPKYMGLYFFATQLIGVPVNMFTASVGAVFYPTFAQSDTRQVSAGIAAYSRYSLKLGVPLLVFFAFALNLVVPLVLGEKWNDALPLLYYLVAYFGTSLLNDPISSIPYICRKPHWELIWNLCSLALRVLVLYLGIRHSFNAAILAFCLASGFMNIVFYLMSLILLRDKVMIPVLKVLAAALFATVLSFVLYWLQSQPLPLLWAGLTFVLYLSGLVITDRALLVDLKSVLRGE